MFLEQTFESCCSKEGGCITLGVLGDWASRLSSLSSWHLQKPEVPSEQIPCLSPLCLDPCWRSSGLAEGQAQTCWCFTGHCVMTWNVSSLTIPRWHILGSSAFFSPLLWSGNFDWFMKLGCCYIQIVFIDYLAHAEYCSKCNANLCQMVLSPNIVLQL